MKNKFYISEFKNYLRGNKLFTNIFLVSSFIMIVLLILFFNYFIYAFFSFDPGDFKVGEPAKRNYVLKSDISFYNEFETNLAKKVEEQLVLPVYKIDKQVNETIISNFNIIKRRLIPLLSSIKNLDLVKEVFNTELSGFFSESEILGLYSLDPELLFTLTLQELQRILNRGYISSEYQVQSSNSGLISVITTTEDNTIIETVSAVSVLQSLRLSNLNNEPYILYISKFLNYFIKVNCYYDVEQTKYNREMST
ncbi:MAG: hypothetical protein JXR64_09350, partial [Spirochaetales bacterium]|nr:hypothetical protein [Spirochaetales bacterium]